MPKAFVIRVMTLYLSGLLLALSVLGWELELGEARLNENVVPREALLHIRHVNAIAIVLRKNLCKLLLDALC